MFQVEQVTVVVPTAQGDQTLVSRASLAVSSGEILDIVGPSGAGKSTLLHALALLIPHISGTITLGDRDTSHMSPASWRAQVALVQQRASLLDTQDIKTNLLVSWHLKVHAGQTPPDDAMLRAALDDAGLADVELTREIRHLSIGQQARVAFLRTLLTHPQVLLLDEIDAALDEASTAAMSELTARAARDGAAIVRVRHKKSDGLSTRILSMHNGVLAPRMSQAAQSEHSVTTQDKTQGGVRS